MERSSSPSSPPSAELALAALRERIRKERDRLAGLPGYTEKLGGLTALGQRVEGLLRAVFEAQWAARGGPEAAFPTVTERGLRYDKASAGQLVHAILATVDRVGATAPLVDALTGELRADGSVLCDLVRLRNATVHGREEAPREELLARLDAALARLGALEAPRS